MFKGTRIFLLKYMLQIISTYCSSRLSLVSFLRVFTHFSFIFPGMNQIRVD